MTPGKGRRPSTVEGTKYRGKEVGIPVVVVQFGKSTNLREEKEELKQERSSKKTEGEDEILECPSPCSV